MIQALLVKSVYPWGHVSEIQSIKEPATCMQTVQVNRMVC